MLYLYILLAALIGVLAGIFTGLFPGIHINLIAIILISSAASLTFVSGLEPIVLVVFLVAMAITHTFVDYIPSIFLGAPDEDNFLSILPGHNMLLKGRAYNAVIYTLYGSVAAILIILVISPIFILFLNDLYPYVQRIMPIILILASIFLIYFEKKSKILALIIFLLAGLLGIASMNLPTNNQSLLPLFTGLFGISSLITSVIKNQEIPKQRITKLKNIKPTKKLLLKPLFASIIASPLVSFLPGLGTGQAAVIGSEVVHPLNQKQFLVLLGAINTTVMGLSFIALYAIGKTRTGTAHAINQLLELTFSNLILILGIIILVGLASFFITIYLAKFFTRKINKINYKSLSFLIIAVLILITAYFSGFYGILILIASSFLGFTTILLGIRRIHLMGALLLPVILFYLI